MHAETGQFDKQETGSRGPFRSNSPYGAPFSTTPGAMAKDCPVTSRYPDISMNLILTILVAAASLLHAQRHLPQTQIFRSPGLLLLDTHVESPAVYDGSGPARLLKRGESFDIQVFAPRAASLSIYEYSFGVDRSPGEKIPLIITSVRDWQDRELTNGKPNRTLFFSSTRFAFSPLPRTGHVMTLTFTATADMVTQGPLDIFLTLTFVSDPPRRVNQMFARQLLFWG